MEKKKIRIGLIFGGRSGEHEVSLASAESVMKNLDRDKYEIVPLGITKEGSWLLGAEPRTVRIARNGQCALCWLWRVGIRPGHGQRKDEACFSGSGSACS